jgi:hypothetical protein
MVLLCFIMFYWNAYGFICIWNNLRIPGNSIYGWFHNGIRQGEWMMSKGCRGSETPPWLFNGVLEMQIINIFFYGILMGHSGILWNFNGI